MRYIESPELYKGESRQRALFLAGGITDCPDWQSEIVSLLADKDITILNPRRQNFPIGDPNASRGQIQWEFENLRKADIILFWFPQESICPIALYELGAWCMTDKRICIGLHVNYERRVDVELQTSLARPEIEIAYSLNELAEQVSKMTSDDQYNEKEACAHPTDCESPAVHSYLELLQAAVNRMASNSASCKSWCITLISAIVVVLIDKEKAQYIFISIAPAIIFALLDSYYLTLEKGFRNKYNNFIKKLHDRSIQKSDLFVMSPDKAIKSAELMKSALSISIYPFYLALIAMIIVIAFVTSDIVASWFV